MFEPFKLERFFARNEFSAQYLLCTSDCESMSIGELLGLSGEPSLALDILQHIWLGYTESRGAPILRDKISNLYPGLDLDSILVHSGAEEAILNLYLAVLQPGDTVIVNWPCYQSLMEIPRSIGAQVLKWKIREQKTGWYFDPDELERLVLGVERDAQDNRVKMLVLNMPHNPTGALMSPVDFGHVIDICRDHEILLFVDEVYRMLELGKSRRLSPACQLYENAISLSVLSKVWGLAGLRIGWLATRRKDILDKVAAVKDYNSICASAPSETLACVALDHYEAIIGKNRELCESNAACFGRFFDRYPELFTWIPPQAGSIAFPAIKNAGTHHPWRDASERSPTGFCATQAPYFCRARSMVKNSALISGWGLEDAQFWKDSRCSTSGSRRREKPEFTPLQSSNKKRCGFTLQKSIFSSSSRALSEKLSR